MSLFDNTFTVCTKWPHISAWSCKSGYNDKGALIAYAAAHKENGGENTKQFAFSNMTPNAIQSIYISQKLAPIVDVNTANK